MKRAVCIFFAALVACGGGAGGEKPKTSAKDTPDGGDTSIGDLASAQGGIAALGGAGNREDGGATGIEIAMGAGLRAYTTDRKRRVKLDGMLDEWTERTPAAETIAGKTDDLSFAVAVEYDADRLYVAGEVTDPRLARTSAHAETDDHASMTIAFPSGRGALKAYEIGMWAGKAGESAGAVKWLAGPSKGQDITGAKLVENEVKGGYTFEAAIPWASFAEARTTRVGLRAALRYHDVDAGGVHGVVATSKGSIDRPQDLAPMPTEPEQAVVDGLLAARSLASTAPSIDVFADVAGDDRKERISVFGKFFTICGPGYRGGRQFFWRAVSGDLVALETRDFNGDGKDDFIVRRRVSAPSGAMHEVLEVWAIPSGDEPLTLLAHEIAIASADGKKRVADVVRVGQKEVEVSVEGVTGWDQASFHEQTASDVEPILLPWGPLKSRTYKLDGKKMVVASELPNAGAPSAPADVPTPAVKSSDASQRVLDGYLRDAGLAATTKPRFDLEVNVDGDGRPERVALVGRDIVVFGPGFKNGAGYTKLSLTQFAGDNDVSEMTARDLTGDGAAELVVRGTRRVKSPQGDVVAIDALFVYTVRGGAVARVFGIETGRELAGKRIQGLVQFVPAKSGKAFDVDVRPGAAKGWTESTYPWPEEKTGGAVEPLLLPWGKTKNLHYTWNGREFAL
ncbi:MAG TPA: sugar-binding protein [Labilithrix sp.]